MQNLWIPGNRRIILCIDSYEKGILQGRIYGHSPGKQPFDSLSQFLITMEQMLEVSKEPQADTIPRSFSALLPQNIPSSRQETISRGNLATFELQILFRQHTSWQGIIYWRDQQQQQSFRSVLELILLLDSALRDSEGREAG